MFNPNRIDQIEVIDGPRSLIGFGKDFWGLNTRTRTRAVREKQLQLDEEAVAAHAAVKAAMRKQKELVVAVTVSGHARDPCNGVFSSVDVSIQESLERSKVHAWKQAAGFEPAGFRLEGCSEAMDGDYTKIVPDFVVSDDSPLRQFAGFPVYVHTTSRAALYHWHSREWFLVQDWVPADDSLDSFAPESFHAEMFMRPLLNVLIDRASTAANDDGGVAAICLKDIFKSMQVKGSKVGDGFAISQEAAVESRLMFGELRGYDIIRPYLSDDSAPQVYFEALKICAQSTIKCPDNKDLLREAGLLHLFGRYLLRRPLTTPIVVTVVNVAIGAFGDVLPTVEKMLLESASAVSNSVGSNDKTRNMANTTLAGQLGYIPPMLEILESFDGSQSHDGLRRKAILALKATVNKVSVPNCARFVSVDGSMELMTTLAAVEPRGQLRDSEHKQATEARAILATVESAQVIGRVIPLDTDISEIPEPVEVVEPLLQSTREQTACKFASGNGLVPVGSCSWRSLTVDDAWTDRTLNITALGTDQACEEDETDPEAAVTPPLFKNADGYYLYYYEPTDEWRISTDDNRERTECLAYIPAVLGCLPVGESQRWRCHDGRDWITSEDMSVALQTTDGAEMLRRVATIEHRLRAAQSQLQGRSETLVSDCPVSQINGVFRRGEDVFGWPHFENEAQVHLFHRNEEWQIGVLGQDDAMVTARAPVAKFRSRDGTLPVGRSSWSVWEPAKNVMTVHSVQVRLHAEYLLEPWP